MVKASSLCLLTTAMISGGIYAQENSEAAPEKWTGDAKLGVIYAQSDNSSLSVNSGLSIKHEKEQQTQQLSLATFYAHQSEKDGTNKYRIIYDLQRLVSEDFFWFANGKYEHDQFATYRHQALATTGFGMKIHNEKTKQLELGAGPGYRYTRRQAFDKKQPDQSEQEIIANLFMKGKWQSSESLELGGGVRLDYGDSNTITSATAYLKNKLSEQLALRIDSEYIYTRYVAKGKKHDEVYSTLSLSYAF